MAFSIRKMFSNISYFSKPEGDADFTSEPSKYIPETQSIQFDSAEPDSTSRCSTSLKLPESVRNYATKKGSLSDTDIISVSNPNEKRKAKKLKLDIKKASQSLTEAANASDSSNNVENTPKHIYLDPRSADYNEKFPFDFNRSFDFSDDVSQASHEDDMDIESLSDQSDSETSLVSSDDLASVKMCRKVEPESQVEILMPSATPESFGDVEVDKNEDDRIRMLLDYQMKLEKYECFIKKMLSELQFHIEVSKIFKSKSVVTTLPGTDFSKMPKVLGDVKYIDNIQRGISPTGSWNIVLEKEDGHRKLKLKSQLLTIKQSIDDFISTYLQEENEKKMLSHTRRSVTFDMHKGKRQHKKNQMSNKKKIKHFDFPDLREAMVSLFCPEEEDSSISASNITQLLSDCDDITPKCSCHCHSPQTDSGLTSKTDQEATNQSITSSIGNFTLDSTTLSAFSESLDQIVSYNSFQDTSLYCTLLQKAAIERITFYVQVHSVELRSVVDEEEFESKNVIVFYCPSCDHTENDENGLLKHILSQKHCEKIHFLYKTAYIKKCVAAGTEIQPSTVLNPMKMYRDDNKIVCFGDALYACSLCFENLIVGESILMAHCNNMEHVDRRDRLSDIID